MLKRNEKAVCKTCPYWDEENRTADPERSGIFWGRCRKDIVSIKSSEELNWCGSHPDFWAEGFSHLEQENHV